MGEAVEGYRAPAAGRRSAFSSLQNPQYRWLYASNLAFFFAMNGQFVVRSYLAYKITDSARALGYVNLMVAIPMLLVSPIGGVMSDRIERRKLIIGGQMLLVANELFILTMLLLDMLQFWHLLVVVFVMGCTFPFIMPARQAIVANIVGKQGMSNAMALGTAAMNAARVVAPALAGFLIYLVDVKLTYIIAVSLYGLAFFFILRVLPSQPPERPVRRSIYGDAIEGMKYVWRDPPVRVLLFLGIVPMALSMPFQSLLVVFAEDVWDTGSRGLGLLQAAAGLGGLAGSFYVAWFGETPRKLRLMMTSLVAFTFALLAFALSPWFILGMVFVLVADVFVAIFQTLNNTVIQVLVPDEVRGRVMSLMMMTFGLTPLGTMPVAAAAEEWGAPVAVGGASMVTLVVALLFLAFSRSLRGIDVTAQAALTAPEPQMAPRRVPLEAVPGGD